MTDRSIEAPDFTGQERPRVLTFLIADIRGYTQFTLERGDEAAARLTARFAAIARDTTQAYEGHLLESRGDEILSVFPSVRQALRAAWELQQLCRAASAEDSSLPLHIGIGLDAGEAVPAAGGLRGTALNLAARLCAAAAPGEVLLSETVASLARKVEGLEYAPRGAQQFKGFDAPVAVLELVSTEQQDVGRAAPGLTPSAAKPPPVGGFLGAVPSGRLVDRRAELGRLLDAVRSLPDGGGRLFLLTGEPGVGKTRLAQEVALSATGQGFIVASGRCYDQRTSVPFYPFLEVLSTAYRLAPPALQSKVPQRWPDLARLLPDELGAPRDRDEGDPQKQDVLFAAVTSFLLALASTAPIALLLDDLQWADGPSLDLLQHLARQTRASPTLILGTYRDASSDWHGPLEGALRTLSREELVETIRLSRLDRIGTADLVHTSLGEKVAPAVPALIHDYAAGNPFFTRQLLQALVERGDVHRQNDGWTLRATAIAIPETVRLAVAERLAHLDGEAQEVLREASVLGATFTFTDLAVMNRLSSQRSEDEVEAALDRATDSRLIVEAGPDGYTFSHALVQQTIYAGLPSRRRRKLHSLAGEVLAQAQAELRARRAGEIAWHFLQGGEPEQSVQHTLLAAEQAETVFAHAEAERFYRQALSTLDQNAGFDASPLLEARVRWRLGRVLKNLARYDEALAELEEADRIFRERGSVTERLSVAMEIGNVQFATGALTAGIERIERLLREVETRDRLPAETARLYVPLAHLYMAGGQARASLEAAERAADLASVAGEDRIRAQAQAIRGDALRLLGEYDAALRVLQETVEVVRSTGDADAEFLALDAVAELLMARGELRESERYRRQAMALVERMGDPAKIAWELTSLGHLLFCLGRWAEARKAIGDALAVVEAVAPSRVTAYALTRLATCDIGEGRWDEARRRLDESISLSEQVASWATEIVGHALLAELDLRDGEPARALARLQGHVVHQDLSDSARAGFLALVAWAHLAMGARSDALEASVESVRAARSDNDRSILVDVLRVAGMVAADRADWQQAEEAFEEAESLARSMPFPYAEARALQARGGMERRRGREDMAVLYLGRAAQIFRELGAPRDADDCAAQRSMLLQDSR